MFCGCVYIDAGVNDVDDSRSCGFPFICFFCTLIRLYLISPTIEHLFDKQQRSRIIHLKHNHNRLHKQQKKNMKIESYRNTFRPSLYRSSNIYYIK